MDCFFGMAKLFPKNLNSNTMFFASYLALPEI